MTWQNLSGVNLTLDVLVKTEGTILLEVLGIGLGLELIVSGKGLTQPFQVGEKTILAWIKRIFPLGIT